MRGYVASRDRGATRKAIEALAKRRFVCFDWTQGPSCKYDDSDSAIAVTDYDALMEAWFFLMMWWPGMTAGYTEMGVALGRKIPVIVVGADKRDNVFLRHPMVVHVATLPEAVETLCTIFDGRLRCAGFVADRTVGVTAKCCTRAGEYNGYASGPLSFVCPNHCACHD